MSVAGSRDQDIEPRGARVRRECESLAGATRGAPPCNGCRVRTVTPCAAPAAIGGTVVPPFRLSGQWFPAGCEIVEQGETGDIVDRPAHPYTRGLIGSVPSRNTRGGRLFQIPGMTPSLLNLAPGCAFRERCPAADGACLVEPETSHPLPGRELRCHHPQLEAAP